MGPSNKKNFDARIIVLIFLVIIETMGIGIIMPMSPELFILKSSPLLAATTSTSIRHLFFGLSIALWPLGMFFGTPFWGEVSDKFGRKKVFITCLLVTSISYLTLALAIKLASLYLFLITRLISGFFAGSYELAHASAADISTPATKPRNMGWIIFAFGFGSLVGPLITSFTCNRLIFAHATISTPLFVASSMSLINALLMLIMFKDTFMPKKIGEIRFKKVFSSFLFVFNDRRVSYLNIILLFMSAGWILFFTGLPILLTELFHLNTIKIGFIFSELGLANILCILFLQKKTLKLFSLKEIIIYAIFLSSSFLFMAIFTSNINVFAFLIFLFALFELLSYSSFMAFFSNAVSPEEQGQVMGGAGATTSLAFIIASLTSSSLADISSKLPLIGSVVAYLLAGILTIRISRKN